MKPVRNVIFVLGDQLSPWLSSLEDVDPDRDIVLMCEFIKEATYVWHHKKKIVFIFFSRAAPRGGAPDERLRGAVYEAG